ncbi:MAG: hypothetical protein GC152_09135 [Alphaproteobacteria bacterium]|nr:hypothetical protein [Alphaproteobacteria bacterium]
MARKVSLRRGRSKRAQGVGAAAVLGALVAAWGGMLAGQNSRGHDQSTPPVGAGQATVTPPLARPALRRTASVGDNDPVLRRIGEERLGGATKGTPAGGWFPAKTADRFAPPVVAERLPLAPGTFAHRPPRPRIALIVDDLGLDDDAFEAVLRLPGPLTLSFLPYGRAIQTKVDLAKGKGHAIMLHLPMEPLGEHEPGPHALRRGMDASAMSREIAWSLSRFKGFTGVNNHMGSALTRDAAAMRTVMHHLRPAAAYFLDSVTVSDSVATAASAAAGLPTFRRDVFLDAAPGRASVVEALGELEAIAAAHGFAIGIVHPRATSLATVGAWLATAPERGFDLVTMDDLARLSGQQVLAAATP